jgi:glycosyltransferase involved in cell wall biosynthesis
MKITAAIITLNEERNIRRCLDSLYDIVDEIIVVDSKSTDHTVEIAAGYGAKVIEKEFEGHIQQKNFAISQAGNPYVLSLDADESLSRNLRNALKKLKSSENYADGYKMKRKNFFLGKWIDYGIWIREYKIRLFHKDMAYWGGTNPHDHIVMKPGSRVKKLNGNLLHYPYESISEFVDQMNKFSSIAASSYAEKGLNSTIFKIIVNPLWRFIRSYFLNLGFMDGIRGLFLSTVMSFYAFMKYLKLWFLNSGRKRMVKN